MGKCALHLRQTKSCERQTNLKFRDRAFRSQRLRKSECVLFPFLCLYLSPWPMPFPFPSRAREPGSCHPNGIAATLFSNIFVRYFLLRSYYYPHLTFFFLYLS